MTWLVAVYTAEQANLMIRLIQRVMIFIAWQTHPLS